MSDNPEQPKPPSSFPVPSIRDSFFVVGAVCLVSGVCMQFGAGVALIVWGAMLLAIAGVSFAVQGPRRPVVDE